MRWKGWWPAIVLLVISLRYADGLRASALVLQARIKAEEAKNNPPPVVEGGDNGNGTTNGTAVQLGPKLTGIPQLDYIHDPNLPRELKGHDLSTYPFYNAIPPDIEFECDGLHDGFYASVPHHCQVYHHCLFGTRYDFLCANYTAFDQKTFICHFVSEVDCVNSPKYYKRNEALYKQETTQAPSTTKATTTKPPTTTAAATPVGGPPSGGSRRAPGGGPRAAGPGRRPRPHKRRRPVYEYYYDDVDYEEGEYYDDPPAPSRTRRPTSSQQGMRGRRPHYEDRRRKGSRWRSSQRKGYWEDDEMMPHERYSGRGSGNRKRYQEREGKPRRRPYFDYEDEDYEYYDDEELEDLEERKTSRTKYRKEEERKRPRGGRPRKPRPQEEEDLYEDEYEEPEGRGREREPPSRRKDGPKLRDREYKPREKEEKRSGWREVSRQDKEHGKQGGRSREEEAPPAREREGIKSFKNRERGEKPGKEVREGFRPRERVDTGSEEVKQVGGREEVRDKYKPKEEAKPGYRPREDRREAVRATESEESRPSTSEEYRDSEESGERRPADEPAAEKEEEKPREEPKQSGFRGESRYREEQKQQGPRQQSSREEYGGGRRESGVANRERDALRQRFEKENGRVSGRERAEEGKQSPVRVIIKQRQEASTTTSTESTPAPESKDDPLKRFRTGTDIKTRVNAAINSRNKYLTDRPENQSGEREEVSERPTVTPGKPVAAVRQPPTRRPQTEEPPKYQSASVARRPADPEPPKAEARTPNARRPPEPSVRRPFLAEENPPSQPLPATAVVFRRPVVKPIEETRRFPADYSGVEQPRGFANGRRPPPPPPVRPSPEEDEGLSGPGLNYRNPFRPIEPPSEEVPVKLGPNFRRPSKGREPEKAEGEFPGGRKQELVVPGRSGYAILRPKRPEDSVIPREPPKKVEVTAPGPSGPGEATVRPFSSFGLDLPEEEYDVTLNDALQPSTLHPTQSLGELSPFQARVKSRGFQGTVPHPGFRPYILPSATQQFFSKAEEVPSRDSDPQSTVLETREYQAVVVPAPRFSQPRFKTRSGPREWFW